MYSIDKETAQEEKKVVNVVPLLKGKRVLVFLADLFICFIATFVLLNAMVMPIGQTITGFNEKKANHDKSLSTMHDILYKNKVVLASDEYDLDDIDSNIGYTFDCWLSYYTLDEETSPDEKHKQYGHKVDNKVIYHYFTDIVSDNAKYQTLFETYNKTNHYFTLSGDDYILPDNVKNELAAYFDPKITIGDNGKTFYKNIKNNVFTPLLAEVFTSIKTNDLTYNGESYNKCQKVVNEVTQFLKDLLTYTIIIAYVLACIIFYLVIPLINKNRKTIAMMMMRIERINIERLYICKRSESISIFIISLLTNMVFIFILPITYVSFTFIFNLNTILIFSLMSLVLILASLIFMLFNSFNRTLSDFFSRSVLITTDTIDDIYRARGYNV